MPGVGKGNTANLGKASPSMQKIRSPAIDCTPYYNPRKTAGSQARQPRPQ